MYKRQMFDYSACKYPIGVVEDEIYYFNEENIDSVIFKGYSDQDEVRFQAVSYTHLTLPTILRV
ncbi:hypothetical protein JMUB7523_26530 [Staphylococcus aureus]